MRSAGKRVAPTPIAEGVTKTKSVKSTVEQLPGDGQVIKPATTKVSPTDACCAECTELLVPKVSKAGKQYYTCRPGQKQTKVGGEWKFPAGHAWTTDELVEVCVDHKTFKCKCLVHPKLTEAKLLKAKCSHGLAHVGYSLKNDRAFLTCSLPNKKNEDGSWENNAESCSFFMWADEWDDKCALSCEMKCLCGETVKLFKREGALTAKCVKYKPKSKQIEGENIAMCNFWLDVE